MLFRLLATTLLRYFAKVVITQADDAACAKPGS